MTKFIFACFVLVCSTNFAQTTDLHLKNALIIGQLDKADDRYSIEIALTEIFTEAGIKAMPSLNVIKVGGDILDLSKDSLQKIIALKGIDTYMTINVRGFDKKFKLATNHDNLATALTTSHLFPLYRDETVNVSFEFTFYREGKFMGTDIIKCGNVSSRDSVLKKFRKKTAKRLKKWM